MSLSQYSKRLLILSCWIFLSACGGEGNESTSPDNIAPVITLNGDSTINLLLNETYQELGASATDDRDGNVEVTISGEVDTSKVGNYTISYAATDTAGNTSQVTRTITVSLPPDITPPVITLNGESTIDLLLNETYQELGASATDDRDGNIEVIISGKIDTSKVGDYTISYAATDAAGNTSNAIRTVKVSLLPDEIAPVITLNGDNVVNISLNDGYVESGATAADDRDGDIDVIITGEIDTSTIGSYILTYSAADSSGNSSSATRTVIVYPAGQRPFVTTWKTNNVGLTENNQIMIATRGDGYDYTVHWGDGTFDEQVSGDITHTYAVEGEYTVLISGHFPQIYFSPEYNLGAGVRVHYNDPKKLLSIVQWGDIVWKSMYSAFNGCWVLDIKAIDTPDLSNVTNMDYMFAMGEEFAYASRTYSGSNIGNWDVSNVTSMSHLFNGAANFNEDIGGWDVTNVTNMSHMFALTPFNKDIGNWSVSNVTNMEWMFNSGAFDQDISGWDVSNVNNMSNMFSGGSLSRTNYDALIIGWSNLSLQHNVSFGAGSTQYSVTTQPYRDILTVNFDWTIYDGGPAN